MNAVILAAGMGRRLRSITYAIPKPLLPLAGGTLLDYLLARLTQAGIGAVALVVRETARWREYVPDTVTLLEQQAPWTLAQALATAREVAPADAPLLILHGDNLVDADLTPLPRAMTQASVGVVLIGEEDKTQGTTGLYWLPAQALDLIARHPEVDDLADLWPLLGRPSRPWPSGPEHWTPKPAHGWPTTRLLRRVLWKKSPWGQVPRWSRAI